jgi:hypothetical protein
MFHWYESAEVCYAYLQDVPSGSDVYEHDSAFRKSRWFTRGWTLQELLAPERIDFYDSNWTLISPISLNYTIDREWIDLLEDITSIPEYIFGTFGNLSQISAACKLSWMAGRNTTRVEDEAYCLLGLLDINMPLLYGEGEKAFIRLQEAVLSGSDDISLLAWGYNLPYMHHRSCLARSPAAFLEYPRENIYHIRLLSGAHTTVTGRGLHIELFMVLIEPRNKIWLGIIEAEQSKGKHIGIGIVLKQDYGGNKNVFERAGGCPPIRNFQKSPWGRLNRTARRKLIYIRNGGYNSVFATTSISWESLLSDWSASWETVTSFWRLASRSRFIMGVSSIDEAGYTLSSSWPPVFSDWVADRQLRFIYEGQPISVCYLIFGVNSKNVFAVRLNIRWESWAKGGAQFMGVAFCQLGVGYDATAVEHCCGTKVGSKAPQFVESMHWSPCLAARNIITNETGHLCATYEIGQGERPSNCELIWKKGPYTEGESTSASRTDES